MKACKNHEGSPFLVFSLDADETAGATMLGLFLTSAIAAPVGEADALALVEGHGAPVEIRSAASHPSTVLPFCPESYESGEGQLVKALHKEPRGLVLDVGAFDGTNAIEFAKAGHEVFSFEPSPSKRPLIEKAWRMSSVPPADLRLFSMALSNKSGTADFWVRRQYGGRSAVINSGELGSEQDMMGPKPSWPAERVEVPIDTLDHIIGPTRRVLYAKIDAQGYDADVIMGAKDLILSKRIQTIAFELSIGLGGPGADEKYENAARFLANSGYDCFDCGSGLGGTMRAAPSTPLSVLLKNLKSSHFDFMGKDIGQWTDLVCVLRASSDQPSGGSSALSSGSDVDDQ